MAKFLQKTAGLDKAIVGEYLGEREDQALRVMHAYVDALDFTGLEFDEAIRCGASWCLMQQATIIRAVVWHGLLTMQAQHCASSTLLCASSNHQMDSIQLRMGML